MLAQHAQHLRAVALHVYAQPVARLVDRAVELAVDHQPGGALAVDREHLDAVAAHAVAREEERLAWRRVDAVRRVQLDHAGERGVGDDDVVAATGMHAVQRYVHALERAAGFDLVEYVELAVRVDVEGGDVVEVEFAAALLVGADPQALPARVAGLDVVAGRRLETRLDAGGQQQREQGEDISYGSGDHPGSPPG